MSRRTFATITAALVTAASFVATTVDAQSYRAYNRGIVNPAGNGTFEAIEGIRFGARGMWCAAADYALNQLGAPGTSRLYVQSPRGNSITAPGRKGVVFGLSVPAGVSPVSVTSTSSAIRVPGANLSVDHAFQFCYDSRVINSR